MFSANLISVSTVHVLDTSNYTIMLHVSVHIEIVILTLSVHNVYIMSMLTIYSYNYISLNKYDDVYMSAP